MENVLSVKRVVLLVAVITVAMMAWLALMPATHGGHDHDHGSIAAIMSVEQLDAGPSCTHSRNTHYHDSGRIRHVTTFGSSHKHSDGTHHHHGKLDVYATASHYDISFDKQCPKH